MLQKVGSVTSASQEALPAFWRAARSWRKPLKGASPVPGPTITTGVLTCLGNLKWECLTKMGSRSPAQA